MDDTSIGWVAAIILGRIAGWLADRVSARRIAAPVGAVQYAPIINARHAKRLVV